MSKIDFTRKHKISVEKTGESLGLINKKVKSKVITLRLTATDEERLKTVLDGVNLGRATALTQSTILKELIKVASSNSKLLKDI